MFSLHTELEITRSAVAQEGDNKLRVRRLCLHTLCVKLQCFSVAFAYEVLVSLRLEVLSNLYVQIIQGSHPHAEY